MSNADAIQQTDSKQRGAGCRREDETRDFITLASLTALPRLAMAQQAGACP